MFGQSSDPCKCFGLSHFPDWFHRFSLRRQDILQASTHISMFSIPIYMEEVWLCCKCLIANWPYLSFHGQNELPSALANFLPCHVDSLDMHELPVSLSLFCHLWVFFPAGYILFLFFTLLEHCLLGWLWRTGCYLLPPFRNVKPLKKQKCTFDLGCICSL
jgi:hypothetical protein